MRLERIYSCLPHRGRWRRACEVTEGVFIRTPPTPTTRRHALKQAFNERPYNVVTSCADAPPLRHSERSKRAGGTLRSRTSQNVQRIARFGEQNAIVFWNLARVSQTVIQWCAKQRTVEDACPYGLVRSRTTSHKSLSPRERWRQSRRRGRIPTPNAGGASVRSCCCYRITLHS